jgi:hypothetical protein
MAIYGAGSKWDDVVEKNDDFFRDENYVIGWDYWSAKDLYNAVGSLKAGDIIYLKSNAPGSRSLRIKGIGIVIKGLVQSIFESPNPNELDPEEGGQVFIKVKWVVKDEFHIVIPPTEGRLTNVRAATFYEEYLPYVQDEILKKLIETV